jgi:hypothetical protein
VLIHCLTKRPQLMEHFTNVLDYPPVVSSSETAPK